MEILNEIFMKNFFKAIPFLLVLGYAINVLFNEWESLNELKLFGFSFGIVLLIYFSLIVITGHHVDFKNGLKLKKIKKE